MCGIAGLVDREGVGADDQALVLRMRDTMVHRGPDDAGIFVDSHAVLGHRRLSIVDLAGGAQPLSNEDRSIWIVYNGEIYNHADLRRQLEPLGHRYRTRSDTETIVHAYEEWGEDCVTRFRGMFAFALWDTRQQRLLLARDRLGVKPLYWTIVGTRLYFGSEIKAILASRAVRPCLREAALPELLSMRSLAGDETLFAGIRTLMPGHLLSFAGGRATLRRYWTIPRPVARPALRRAADDVRQFRALLEESVRLRLMSDVPLGVFLSGGLDSSAIAALMAPMMGRPLDTFSVAFANRAYNELAYSREVARSLGANTHEVVMDDRDFFSALPRLVWHEDEPIAHPSSVSLHVVSTLASRQVKVVLTGEGSDELLAGYGRYPRALLNWRAGALYSRVPAPLRALVAGGVRRLPGKAGRYARRSFLAIDQAPELHFFDNFAAINLQRLRQLLSPRLAADVRSSRVYAEVLSRFNEPDRGTTLDRLLYTDLGTYLVELLMKQDQMSMSASIESRVPFLDHHLVEYAAALPPERKLSGFNTKRILRDAVADVVPASVLSRSKMGFPVPFAQWMRGPWNDVARDVLLDRRARERDLMRPGMLDTLLNDARSGVPGAADAIWSLLNLELWHRTFIDGDGIQTLPQPRASRQPTEHARPAAAAAESRGA
jgi:asparagine synthase (glutamine-hydrolysing)